MNIHVQSETEIVSSNRLQTTSFSITHFIAGLQELSEDSTKNYRER